MTRKKPKEVEGRLPSHIAEDIVANIERAQEHIKAVEGAAYFLNGQDGFRHRDSRISAHDLRQGLVEYELEQWRRLFMWGLVLDAAGRDRVKAMAHSRFLGDRTHVANWLTRDGNSPSGWAEADEIAFRAMARAYFAPSAPEEPCASE